MNETDFALLNFPQQTNKIGHLQSGLSLLLKRAEEENKTLSDYVLRNGIYWQVPSRTSKVLTINTSDNSCTCEAEGHCWHKALVSCLILNKWPKFDYDTTAVSHKDIQSLRHRQEYQLSIKIRSLGGEFILPIGGDNFAKPLSYWKEIVSKTADKTLLIFNPDDANTKALLAGKKYA